MLHRFLLDTLSHGGSLIDTGHYRGHFDVFGRALHLSVACDSLHWEVVSLLGANLLEHAIKLHLRDHLCVLVPGVVQLLLKTSTA